MINSAVFLQGTAGMAVQAVSMGCLSLVEHGILSAVTHILSMLTITFSYLVKKIIFKGFL